MREEVLMRPSRPMRPRTASLPAPRARWGGGRLLRILGLIATNVGVFLILAIGAELAFGQWIMERPLGRLAVPRNVKKTISAAPLYRGGTEFIYRRDAFGFPRATLDPAGLSSLKFERGPTNHDDR